MGLAQVLIRDPKLLLRDEPFGPLDAQTRQKVQLVLAQDEILNPGRMFEAERLS